MDTEALKARSIELAERAYRQKDRAQDTLAKSRLDDAADELIKVDNPLRFYTAQSKLEVGGQWTEEQRALAHEINVADQSTRDLKALLAQSTLQTLESWANLYMTSTSSEVKETGQNIYTTLQNLTAQESPNVQKEALNYLMSILESILSHAQSEKALNPINSNVLILRNMRDSLLSARELLFDDAELLSADSDEVKQVDRVELARESLQEIYAHIDPTRMPKF